MTRLPSNLATLRRLALLTGVASFILCAIGWIVSPLAFYRAYLWSFEYFLGISLGSLAWVMIHHLVGGGWGRALQRLAEAAAMNLPLMAILFVPILFGLHHLYPWANPHELQHDVILRHREPYLNGGAFFLRAVVYFIVWIAFAMLMVHGSTRYDRTHDYGVAFRMRRTAAAGLVLYVLTMTLAGIDWIMSRDAHYFSSIFGFILVVGQALTALAFLIIIVTLLLNRDALPFGEPLRAFVTRGHFNDLGNLVLTCVILWTYVSFFQFLINWMGNMQEEVKWYLPRMHGFYGACAAAIILFHFFVPFFMLLSKHLKRHPEMLARLCGLILAVRLLADFWLVAPTGAPADPSVNRFWLNVTVPVALGALWLAAFLWQLERRPILAVPEHGNPSAMSEHDADPNPNPKEHGQRHAHPA